MTRFDKWKARWRVAARDYARKAGIASAFWRAYKKAEKEMLTAEKYYDKITNEEPKGGR